MGELLEAQLLGAAALHLSTRPAHREHLRRLKAKPLGDTPSQRQLLANLALWTSSEGEHAAVVIDLCERALAGGRLLQEAGPDSQMFYAAVNALLYAEAFELARSWFDRALAEARARGSLFGFAMASAMRAECDHRMGDLGEAEADAHAAIEAGGPGHWVLAPVAVSALAQVLIERGRFDAARSLLMRSQLPHGLDQPGMTNWLPFAEGHLHLATGEWAQAASCFSAVGEWMAAWGERDPGLLDWRTGAALALAHLGERDRARELSAEVIALGRDLGKPRALGVGLRTAGVIEDSVELLVEAVETLAGAAAALEHARASIELGAALRRRNHRKDAREPLRVGIELAQRCGATALMERGQAELVAAGARPRRVALRGVEALTPSERRVAGLAVDGLSTPEIAQQLFVTVNTVESHLRHTYSKLGVHSRDELKAALGSATGEGDLNPVG
jgi:ATP/maltotriose-dependent transcriptional regulator MalT